MIEIDVSLARSTGFRLEAHFTAPGAGVTALFGRSGSGKTTIIQLVAGSVRPDSGRIVVGDEVFFDADRGIDLPMERRGTGYVFQDARLFPHMTVENNLRYGERRARRERTIRFDVVVDMLGIGHLLKRRPHTLSGGEKQRVAIGRALLSQPRLLLMDEPLASLDEMRKGEILPYLERLRDDLKLPILYVSHSIEEVLRLSDAVAAVTDGSVIACGPLADVLSRPELLPILGRFDLGTIFDCTVTAHDEEFGLSTVAFADGELRVPLVGRPVGAPARARIRSRDVSLSLSRPIDVSVTNRLSGTITRIIRAEGPFSDVEVGLAHGRLHALVTQESVQRLALEPGMPVWAMIKAVTVDSRPAGFASPGAEINPPSPAPQSPPPALRVIAGGNRPQGTG
ncbi:molybdenum ABC transporter ATP-binding protein [Xanthobacter dioxanivorans]|uniref:Molybdenum ABC transporter ATP-binding protein n=1 Tax=Xanthobacter dioxanivorans TaxID=2528964 RepID=A0A974SGN1_9HYPH|nr:molybdenum ABC transporter ATP-binding protein [Xanthobacter dioxanivorans]QRG04870.1 molybdenum ABC transporter ATP-binding protein [Xanthobacter dioxanivorans]